MPNGIQNDALRPLHLNINLFSESPYAIYPVDQNEELAQLFIKYLKSESFEDISFLTRDHLLFISASEAIDLLIRTFCDPHDTVCFTKPTFPLYEYCSENQNCRSIGISLEGPNLDLFSVLDILKHRPKLTFLTTPNNPTGVILNTENVSELIKSNQGILAIDEAYTEFSDQASYISQISKSENLVILRSFSKIWGLAGIRTGVTIGPPLLIQTLRTMMTPCNFPKHTQEILKSALLNYRDISLMKHLIKQEKERIIQRISRLSIIKKIYPSDANFFLIEFTDADSIHQILMRNGICARNCSQAVPGTLRISLGSIKDNEQWISILEAQEVNAAISEHKP